MAYLESRAERQALLDLPLELRLRGVAEERIIARLEAERGQAEALAAARASNTPVLAVVVLVERTPDLALTRSMRSLALQSNPSIRCVLAPAPHIDLGYLDQFLAELDIAPKSIDVLGAEKDALRSALFGAHYVTFLRHGDRLHPSTAAWLAIALAGAAPADIICWGEHQPGAEAWVQTNPTLHLISLLHFPYLRNAFAVQGALAARYAGDLLTEAHDNDLHLFQIWLAAQSEAKWAAHPEPLLIRAIARKSEAPTSAARRAFTGREAAYASALASRDLLRLVPTSAKAPQPYTLTPKRAARTISVIIPFRDHAALTLRAIASVAVQSAADRTELILVNNQSSPEALDDLRSELMRTQRPPWRIIDYDLPFNHSAQCNLGIRASTAEVVVLLNNDAVLTSPSALDEMAAWALYPGVASVGVALRDPSDGAFAAGMEVRRSAPVTDSLVEERSDPALAPFTRTVFGNSFAAAALPRALFNDVGMLDAARFPNGFNDVEFACRTRARGYTHIVLGHCEAEHARGASRARADESAQKLLLRALYPEAASAALDDLQIHEVAPRESITKPAPAFTHGVTATSSKAPALTPAPLFQRVASRVSASPLAQGILRNPHAYRIIRGAWRLVRRAPT
jgi:GT2 family glycosyltransferase